MLSSLAAAETQDIIRLELAYTPPLAWEPMVRFLAGRGSRQLEQFDGRHYLRTVRINGHDGWVLVEPAPGKAHLAVVASGVLAPVDGELEASLRKLFDLDADPQAITRGLGHDPLLARLLDRNPGLRLPGTLSLFELGLRAILGQQVSVQAATTLFNRLIERFGPPAETPFTGLDRFCPEATVLAEARLQTIIDIGLTSRRAATVQGFARAIADGSLTVRAGDAPEQAMQRLQQLPGIGPWTAHYIAMRALSHADAFPEADIGLLRACGLDKAAQLRQRAEGWRPWRAYAAIHLWNWRNAGG